MRRKAVRSRIRVLTAAAGGFATVWGAVAILAMLVGHLVKAGYVGGAVAAVVPDVGSMRSLILWLSPGLVALGIHWAGRWIARSGRL